MRLIAALLLAVLLGACAYDVPLTATSNVARTSFVYDADGNLVARLHAEEDRVPVKLKAIADVLEDAVIAVEDSRFYHHNGVDLRATVRALFRNAQAGEVVEGGSTITQQYVKNVLIGRKRTVGRKIKEASLAFQMERNFSKKEILERYLNTVYFGVGAYGAQSAAKRFFAKDASQLTLAEAALLAGTIRAPERYDPFENPEAAEARRQLVLRRMRAQSKITEEELERAVDRKPVLKRINDRYPAGHYVEAVKRFIFESDDFGSTRQERRDLLFKGGLHIHTNLDMEAQKAAQDAVNGVLTEPGDPIAALVAVESGTGKVRAMWGGYDYFGTAERAKYNFAMGTGRPTGSAFKPFALVAALNMGIGPYQVFPAPGNITLDLPGAGAPWKVGNYGGGGYGALTLADATVRSTNTVYAQLALEVGADRIIETARDMGVSTELVEVPAAVLGFNNVQPLEMASSFGTLGADGIRTTPKFVDRIEDSDGKEVYRAPSDSRRVLSKMVVRNVNQILKRVITGGTATSARLSDGRDVAGKTGTNQEWRDASFVGYTPELSVAVWVGMPDKPTSLRPPLTRITVTGGSWPAAIWKAFMEKYAVEGGIPPTPFPDAPPFVVTKRLRTKASCAGLEEDEEDIVDDLDDRAFTLLCSSSTTTSSTGVTTSTAADEKPDRKRTTTTQRREREPDPVTTTTKPKAKPPKSTTTAPTTPPPPPPDSDGDGAPDSSDNCPGTANPGQEDGDSDGVGAACDPDDADPTVP